MYFFRFCLVLTALVINWKHKVSSISLKMPNKETLFYRKFLQKYQAFIANSSRELIYTASNFLLPLYITMNSYLMEGI